MSDDQTTRAVIPEPRIDTVLRAILKRAIGVSQYSREQIADELTVRLCRKISPATVDAWTAETKQAWRLPADAVPDLCEILGDDSIQRLLLSEKLKQALELGESATRVVSLLRSALPEPTTEAKG